MSRLMVQVFAVLVIGIALSGQLMAQGGATGAITGTVQDPSGAVIANADVKIVDQNTGVLARDVKTDSSGSFTAPLLPVGTYTITVTSAGFQTGQFKDIVVRITETTRMTAKLQTQAVQEKIEVQAEIQTVQTTDATTGQAIEANTVRTLPLATQNFQQLLTLSSGAQSDLNKSAALGRGDARPIVNGQREDNNNYSIEGITATDYNVAELTNTPLPSPDVVSEFKVQTSLYDASQGRNGGGNINAILKSGTKEFHGDLFEFFRNDKLDANEYFLKGNQIANGQPNTRPVIKQNIFGGSLGGPIGPGAKLGFFFVNYQGTRQRSGLSGGTFISTTVPVLPAARDEASLISTFFPGGLPAGVTGLDPVAVALLNFQSGQFGNTPGGYLFPQVAGTPGGSGQFAVSKPGSFTDDQFTTTWDRDFRNSKDKVSARFFLSNSEQDVPFGAGGLQASLGGSISGSDLNFPYNLPVNDRFLSISETHLFSPALVNDFRFGYVRINNSAINVAPVTVSDLGINRPTNNLTDSIYKFTLLSSGFQLGPTPQANQSQVQNNFDFVETLSWVHGNHTWRFGGEFTPVSLDKQFPQVFNGQLFFTATPDGNTDFQNFLLGSPQFSFGGGGLFNHQYRQKNYAVFAQDDWKVRPDLTLNLGLRTEFFGAWKDNKCHIGNLESDLTYSGQYPYVYPSCVSKLGLSGFSGSGAPSTFRNSVSTGVGPRIGFAWDVMGHHTTTVRGGYGIYYVREDVGVIDQLSFQAPLLPIAFGGGAPGSLANFFAGTLATNPNALPPAGTLDGSYIPCLSIFPANPFPGGDTTQAANYVNTPGCNTVGSVGLFGLEVPRRFVVPNTQQWNLTIQRDLGHRWVLEVGYVGTKGTHLRETRDAIQSLRASASNPVIIHDANGTPFSITTNTFNNAIARTPTPGLNGYSGYQLFANDAYSHYHSLQTTVSRHWGRGYFQAAYTFSKSTDATSTGNTAFNTAYNDQSNINASRGLSDYDRPHRLTVSYVYDLPFYRAATGFKGAALGGWGVSGVTILQSGVPFSVFDSGAGTGFLGAGSTPLLGASLAPGAKISSGLTSGSITNRINGYLNPAAFTTAPLLYPTQCGSDPNFCTTDFGNLGRNIYRGPFQQNWDFSLVKHFKLTERQDLRFTADFFNLWNHPNFANPTVTDIEAYLAAPTDPNNPFGKIVSSSGTPRLIQFSLRWAF
jgi:hypothetical protein